MSQTIAPRPLQISRAFAPAAGGTAPLGRGNRQNKSKAQFWVNVGYPTGNERYPFVALGGFSFDPSDMKELGSNPEKAQLFGAQNELLEDALALASEIPVGEAIIYEAPGLPLDLCLQIRHARPEQDAAAVSASNPLSRRNRVQAAAVAADETEDTGE